MAGRVGEDHSVAFWEQVGVDPALQPVRKLIEAHNWKSTCGGGGGGRCWWTVVGAGRNKRGKERNVLVLWARRPRGQDVVDARGSKKRELSTLQRCMEVKKREKAP